MSRSDPTARYFTRVYPVLRGARGGSLGTRLTRSITEPGQADRLEWVLRELDGCAPQRILDAGCGTGPYAIALARRGHHVTALDVSSLMLSAARVRIAAAGLSDRIEIVEADLRTWEPPALFDTVICMGVLEYYAAAEQILDRLYSWTRQRLLLSVTVARWDVRALVRLAWLGSHGVRARGYEASELSGMVARLPHAEHGVHEMRWAHCVSATRRDPPGSSNGHPTLPRTEAPECPAS